MSRLSKFAQRWCSFLKDQAANTAIMYALSALPAFLAVGASVDFVRYTAAQTHVQLAVDAGALAGAAMVGATDGAREAAAQAAFDYNIKQDEAKSLTPTASFEVIDGKMVVKASVDMPTSFMNLAWVDSLTAEGEAEVGIMTDKKAEVALVLDYSGSMEEVSGTKVKYIAMRDAATKLLSDLSAAQPGKVKFGLVPFSHHVYPTLPSAYVLGAKGSTWTGCTQDRQFPHNLKDSTPTAVAATQWGQPFAPDHAAWGCDGYVSNKLRVRPLTDDIKSLTTQLTAMKPYAWTHIALGVEFGYHLLSPNAPFTEGTAYSDDTTKKFMIVLTDGMQTEPGFGPGKTRTVAQGEYNLEELCKNVKKDGITVITLAFDLSDSTTRKRLQNCSTDSSQHFFVADDDTDLMKAFETIKLAIASEIFLSK